MTLGRQLFAGIIAAFVALLIGIEAIYVSIARGHLEEQLNAHANETATSLALSLGARSSTLDASLVTIMVNPVFDRGHFQSIEAYSAEGQRVFVRALERHEIDVPRWFVALVPIEGARGEALISSGWKQLGKIAVQIHPGYAYRQLFNAALATLAWLAVLFAIALVLVRYYLAGILKPLAAIEQAALAISERNFISIEVQPRARELQRVTAAMNSLSAKIREAISQESERAERLRKEAFEDPLTGELNRRGFEQSVGAKLADAGEVYSGALVLVRVTDLDDARQVHGLPHGDAILKQLAAEVSAPGAHGSAIVGRWEDATLAAFVPNIEQQAALAWVDGLCKASSARLGVAVRGGIAYFNDDTATLARLAEAAEGAVADAAKSGGVLLVVVQSSAQAPGADLMSEVAASIEADRIALLGQKVVTILDQEVLQVELLSSLSGGDGRQIPAGTFVPIASQHGLLRALDMKVIERALRALEEVKTLPWSVSVNISMQSVADAGFRAALKDLLTRNKAIASRLTFEITGYAASRAPDVTKAFADELRRLRVRVALDNFDLDRNSMTIVHELLPAYIKLAPAFTQQIAAREDLRFIVEAMVRMLRPLEIPLVAQGVEDEGTIAILAELGLAAYQGYAAGRPEPLAVS